MSVYCNDCIYLNETRGDFILYFCTSKMNIKRKNNWMGNKIKKNHPRKINKNNDCKWFQNKDVI